MTAKEFDEGVVWCIANYNPPKWYDLSPLAWDCIVQVLVDLAQRHGPSHYYDIYREEAA